MKKLFYLVFLGFALTYSASTAYGISMPIDKINQINVYVDKDAMTAYEDIICFIDDDNKLCFDEDDIIDPGDNSDQGCKPGVDPGCVPRPGNNDSVYCERFPDMCSPQDPPKGGNSSTPDPDAPP